MTRGLAVALVAALLSLASPRAVDAQNEEVSSNRSGAGCMGQDGESASCTEGGGEGDGDGEGEGGGGSCSSSERDQHVTTDSCEPGTGKASVNGSYLDFARAHLPGQPDKRIVEALHGVMGEDADALFDPACTFTWSRSDPAADGDEPLNFLAPRECFSAAQRSLPTLRALSVEHR